MLAEQTQTTNKPEISGTWKPASPSTNDFDLDDFATEQQEGLNFLQTRLWRVDIEPPKNSIVVQVSNRDAPA